MFVSDRCVRQMFSANFRDRIDSFNSDDLKATFNAAIVIHGSEHNPAIKPPHYILHHLCAELTECG
jgi:hypothetical protein